MKNTHYLVFLRSPPTKTNFNLRKERELNVLEIGFGRIIQQLKTKMSPLGSGIRGLRNDFRILVRWILKKT